MAGAGRGSGEEVPVRGSSSVLSDENMEDEKRFFVLRAEKVEDGGFFVLRERNPITFFLSIFEPFFGAEDRKWGKCCSGRRRVRFPRFDGPASDGTAVGALSVPSRASGRETTCGVADGRLFSKRPRGRTTSFSLSMRSMESSQVLLGPKKLLSKRRLSTKRWTKGRPLTAVIGTSSQARMGSRRRADRSTGIGPLGLTLTDFPRALVRRERALCPIVSSPLRPPRSSAAASDSRLGLAPTTARTSPTRCLWIRTRTAAWDFRPGGHRDERYGGIGGSGGCPLPPPGLAGARR